MSIRAFMREPLVHFLVLGGLLFWIPSDGGTSNSQTIVVSRDRIEQFGLAFGRAWQRAPTEEELADLIEGFIQEEVLVREARRLGLDEDDTVIRSHLRQKMEFLSEGMEAPNPPSEKDLAEFMTIHGEKYELDPEIEFRHVYLDPEKHGDRVVEVAEALLGRLQDGGVEVDWSHLGDSLVLPSSIPMKRRREVDRLFGRDFATSVFELEEGRWQGPIESGYGLHLVLVEGHLPSRLPELREVRRSVERDFLLAEQEARSRRLYESLRENYEVRIEWSEGRVTGSS